MQVPAKITWTIILILCALVFSWSLNRDIQSEKQYTGDLRNRVVGARMQEDGLSPYFHKWKKGDGLRYYDPDNFDSSKVANITASPFFHRLLRPIADWPQHRISVFWLAAEYGMLILLLLISLSLASTQQQQWMVLVAACLFLLTESWKMHVANGQNYACIPLLAMVFYYCVCKKQRLTMAFAGGCCAAVLVLIKPTAVLFFIPFLFLWKQYSRAYIVVLLLPLLVAAVWILSSQQEIYLWKQYQENIAQQIKIHQQESPAVQINDPDPGFTNWEGISREEIAKETALHPVHIYSENGNVFVLTRLILHKKMNSVVLLLSSLLFVLLLLTAFYRRHRMHGYTAADAALAGFCLFMLSDLFSPVYRHQYYAVQWMFPVLLAAALYQPNRIKIYAAIAAGVLLNILNAAAIPMEHTVGEYIMLVAFIVLSLRREIPSIQ